MSTQDLAPVVRGEFDPDRPPILAEAWDATLAELQDQPPAAWTDERRLVMDVAEALDCREDLVVELLQTGHRLGKIQHRRAAQRDQVRLSYR